MARSVVVWFRDDLRVHDNPALMKAWELVRANPADLHAVYIANEVGVRPLGGAVKWWLHHSLLALSEQLAQRGVRLHVLSGDPLTLLPQLVTSCGATAVTMNRRYDPAARSIDDAFVADASAHDVEVYDFPCHLLAEPGEITTTTGGSYKVFTPFSRNLRDAIGDLPLDTLAAPPKAEQPIDDTETQAAIAQLGWDAWWAASISKAWTPGEPAAREALAELDDILPRYLDDRDRPDIDGTSRLSPRLRFGELSVAEVWNHAHTSEGFRRQLMWRDFAWHRLDAHPDMATVNIRPEFDRFPWDGGDFEAELNAWCHGRTGIALVDAGMRELWATGTMHNRVRMVAASLLVKNLGIHWRHGEQWFWDTLVDADPASNPFNWQWVAGSGDDAAPYFRIFNPDTQARRFDPDGTYRTRWLPIMSADYPVEAIVDLKESRLRALDAYNACKR
ncbi:cryptochrome/photolyase family protein [Corynebacterium diphtheriae]|uniref:cryptochrome/photolyase family protein n=1 Tax=Corynebacterium diphtheriae TaxID=1717 RepID=UPI0002468353|nr:deoxyribodipyrimidine photo-lyase [Corynebacterium diphtheriae]AEX71079.1 putative riboflavin biosynthesis protein [Corynebacterium diphtheriae CDCE 8392]MCM0017086.1 DNA photolyase family protein [Corynebacterium diphtheriae bv. mitis]MCM0026907.1 DNA photolyase family protein [Corynebacterium diphtheriae bv. mitis]MCM0030571.1 DNA photolyase family protein [Corynebacterium diphtheriae bv. mitis]MCM0037814.1 DNA photolyase family protein [Corynebacterium diphtheriae bv. mitis]